MAANFTADDCHGVGVRGGDHVYQPGAIAPEHTLTRAQAKEIGTSAIFRDAGSYRTRNNRANIVIAHN